MDRYSRMVAVCWAGNVDLSHWLVSQGHAVAFRRYSLDYVAEEDRARVGRAAFGQATSPCLGSGALADRS